MPFSLIFSMAKLFSRMSAGKIIDHIPQAGSLILACCPVRDHSRLVQKKGRPSVFHTRALGREIGDLGFVTTFCWDWLDVVAGLQFWNVRNVDGFGEESS